MTPAVAADGPAVPVEVLAVRRWARLNLWAVVLVFGAALAAFFTLPPAVAETVEDVVFLIAAPPLAVLEILLLLAVYRLFRRSNPTLVLLTVGLGAASALTGLVGPALELVAVERWPRVTETLGLALTAAELLLMGLLLRFAQAGPRGLSRVAVVAAIGCCAALGEQLAPGSWLLLPSLLLFALPWFLFRLSKLVLPNTAGAIAG